MSSHFLSPLNGIITHNLTIVFLIIVVLTVDLSGRKASDDLRMQMIETFTKRKFDVLNQSDIDSIMSFVSKSFRKGRAFHYMWKLREAMEREAKRLDAVEDDSSKDWLIQAFRPAFYDETSVSFTECAICKRTRHTTRCNVTRLELLIPLIHTDSKLETRNDWIFVEINGNTINSSRGTVDISRAVSFDLSNILLKPDAGTPDGVLNITIKKQPCRNVFPNRCMLYEYCNINSTILDRFREYSRGENKNHVDFVEGQPHTNINTSEHDNRQYQMNGNTNRSEPNSKPAFSKKHARKVAHGSGVTKDKQSLVSLQQTTLPTDRTTDMIDQQAYNSTVHNTDAVTHTLYTHENGSLRRVFNDRETRGLREPRAVSSQQIMEVTSSQTAEQQQPQKKKRQLEIPTFRDLARERNGACGNSFEPVQEECQRRSFYVSFQRDMNRWDIIVPESRVDIGYCSSTCRNAHHFSNVNNKLTAHAVIVNSIRGEAPPVTCSPRKMSSIPILKISDDGNSLVVENLFNAKIESCWCT